MKNLLTVVGPSFQRYQAESWVTKAGDAFLEAARRQHKRRFFWYQLVRICQSLVIIDLGNL